MVFVQFLLETGYWLDDFGCPNVPSLLFGSFTIILADPPWCLQHPPSLRWHSRCTGGHKLTRQRSPRLCTEGGVPLRRLTGPLLSLSKPQRRHGERREHCGKGGEVGSARCRGIGDHYQLPPRLQRPVTPLGSGPQRGARRVPVQMGELMVTSKKHPTSWAFSPRQTPAPVRPQSKP